MKIEVEKITLPSLWASALINNDTSGMNDDEIAHMRRYMRDVIGARYPDFYVVDIARDENDLCEPRFSWSYRLFGGEYGGGEVCDYVFHRTI